MAMKNIYLVGMMCSGKSTVGKILAERLGLKYIDTDDAVEEKIGKTIKEIIAADGSEMFMQIESHILETIPEDGYVVSTGGRAFLFDRNIKTIKERGISVFLNTSPEQLAKRLQNHGQHEKRGIAEVDEEGAVPLIRPVYEARLPLYKKSDIEVSGDVDVESVCDILEDKLAGFIDLTKNPGHDIV
jgi:shikimate kinase